MLHKLTINIAIVLGGSLLPFAAAAENFDLSSCVGIESDTDRLKCFDDFFAAGGEPIESEAAAHQADSDNAEEASAPLLTSNWLFMEQKDAFNDSDTSMLVLLNDAGSTRGQDAPKSLVIRCDGDGGIEIYMVFDGYMGGDRNDRVPVRYRFGEKPAVAEKWSISTDGTAAFLPKGYRDFKEGIASGESFIFEGEDFRGSTSSASFTNILHEKFEFVMSGCPN
jgi:hypothetical protein